MNISICRIIPPPGRYLQSLAYRSPHPHRPYRPPDPLPQRPLSIRDNKPSTDFLRLYAITANTPLGTTSPTDGNRDLNSLVLRAGHHRDYPAPSAASARNAHSTDRYGMIISLYHHQDVEEGGCGYRIRRLRRWALRLCLLSRLVHLCFTMRGYYRRHCCHRCYTLNRSGRGVRRRRSWLLRHHIRPPVILRQLTPQREGRGHILWQITNAKRRSRLRSK